MTANTDSEAYRLPYTVAPRRYEILLSPDLEQFSFTGEVAIELEVLEATDRIVLNAIELEIDAAVLRAGWSGEPSSAEHALTIELDPSNERASFIAMTTLERGRYRLECSFRGVLNDSLHGFYRSTYLDTDGSPRYLAVTQFESADARRAFPCFDEPDRKAVFAVTVDVPSGMVAISNGPELSATMLENGRSRVVFGETPVMSSYLVAFVVGDLEISEPLEVDGIPVRVVTVRGKNHLRWPALRCAEFALRYYAEYFALPYLGEKLDLVAVPDFSFGAMENVGCVVFRESILLADEENTSRAEMERLVEVTVHELAHMWFGDLVTMRWWNGLWLNESFATFMALRCADAYHPEWRTFDGFAPLRGAALQTDGLHATRAIEHPARTPAEAEALVDILTYEKGASVLWMVESYIGAEDFRDGVRRFLAEHQFANADTVELWDAIGRFDEALPIRALMDSWIFQGGYPLVTARRDDDDSVTLAQEPFRYIERPPTPGTSAIGTSWLIPLVVANPGATSDNATLLLEHPTRLDHEGPLLVNAGGTGYFRVHYDEQLYRELLASLERIRPIERYNLLADVWALTLAQRIPANEFIALLDRLRAESDPAVVALCANALATLDLVGDGPGRVALTALTRDFLAPILERVGWERHDDEDVDVPLVRATVIGTLGTTGEDAGVIARTQTLVRADLAGKDPLDPDLAATLLGIFIAHATADDFELVLERRRRPRDPKDEARLRGALGMVTDEGLAARVHELCLETLRSQDAPFVLAVLLRNRAVNETTWTFVTEHFEELEKRLGGYGVRRALEGISGLAQLDDNGEPRHAATVRAFCEAHVTGAHRQHIAQSLERLDIHVALAQSLRGGLAQLLETG